MELIQLRVLRGRTEVGIRSSKSAFKSDDVRSKQTPAPSTPVKTLIRSTPRPSLLRVVARRNRVNFHVDVSSNIKRPETQENAQGDDHLPPSSSPLPKSPRTLSTMAPLILHNVPDEELYVGEDGVQRPYAMLFPK
jgi:hypothetical protein